MRSAFATVRVAQRGGARAECLRLVTFQPGKVILRCGTFCRRSGVPRQTVFRRALLGDDNLALGLERLPDARKTVAELTNRGGSSQV